MNFNDFHCCVIMISVKYNPTLSQLKYDLLRFRSNKDITKSIDDIIINITKKNEYTQDELKFKLYNWIEYIFQNHADLITLDNKLIDLIQKINDREILYENDFIIPDGINNKKRVLSIKNQTKVIGYVDDIFINLNDFDVAILHFPCNSTLHVDFRLFY